MDPVSQILADRERTAPRMLPWWCWPPPCTASSLETVFLYGRTAAARPAHLPVVSVKLVRPDRPPGGPALASKPRPTAAAPAPKPTAAATAVPRPQPTAPSRSRASEKAMAAPKPAATPVRPKRPSRRQPAPGAAAAAGAAAVAGRRRRRRGGRRAGRLPLHLLRRAHARAHRVPVVQARGGRGDPSGGSASASSATAASIRSRSRRARATPASTARPCARSYASNPLPPCRRPTPSPASPFT